MMLYSCSM